MLSNCFHSLPLFRMTRQALYLPDTTATSLLCTQPSAESAKKVVWAGWPVGLGMRVESEGRGGVLSSPGSRGRIVGRRLGSRHFVVRVSLRQSALVAVVDGGLSVEGKGMTKTPMYVIAVSLALSRYFYFAKKSVFRRVGLPLEIQGYPCRYYYQDFSVTD